MLRSRRLAPLPGSGARHYVMGWVNENRARLKRYRRLPCIGACGLRHGRYAFTSHSFSSCPMHREQRGEPKREPRRAPSSIHRLIMDNNSHAGATPLRELWYALQGYTIRRGTSPVRMSQHTKGAEGAQEPRNVAKIARFKRLPAAVDLEPNE